MVDWTNDLVSRALNYWVARSKASHDSEALDRDCAYFFLYMRGSRQFYLVEDIYTSVQQHGGLPCMLQADLFVRSMFSDPAVGYAAPFIVLAPTAGSRFSIEDHGMARVLFRALNCAPSLSLLQSFPQVCSSSGCSDAECKGFFLHDELWALDAGSPMVCNSSTPEPIHVDTCNHRECTQHNNLTVCSVCHEAKYCSKKHQASTVSWRFFLYLIIGYTEGRLAAS